MEDLTHVTMKVQELSMVWVEYCSNVNGISKIFILTKGVYFEASMMNTAVQ